MSEELSKQYEPAKTESAIYQRWLDAGAFAATPGTGDDKYVIMMPLPNVTGALHMGHAMDNVMQDLLIRWHRMRGDMTLWMPGTDHAGIATQAVVEKRLLELEGKTRLDLGREELVKRIWDWKDQYQARIISQQQAMGCSCDWDRQRFTMDEVCARAVRYTFFRMFEDKLIVQGNRLVNWDCKLQTAVSDDEIEVKTVDGHFWHLQYPILDPKDGEPDHVIVATTRPETMLGDTAVACHPDPEAALEAAIEKRREALDKAPKKEREERQAELDRVEARRASHLPGLKQLAAMAADGRRIRLPIVDREIPLITDEWAKPELGSGCVKITPAHDPNDYEVWGRHRGAIGIINLLNADGSLNENAGPHAGKDRFAARRDVVSQLKDLGHLQAVDDRKVEIGHSDRSKTPIEPYISRQWFLRMGDVEGGVVCAKGTPHEMRVPGLAQAAIDAVAGEWRSRSDRKLEFQPDHGRYAGTYLSWLSEKRDWCISRQLWWGHQIPIWSCEGEDLSSAIEAASAVNGSEDVSAWLVDSEDASHPLDAEGVNGRRVLVCLRDVDTDERVAAGLEAAGFVRDPDVLDTWFSSGLWPHSTLGWPDPETAQLAEGQASLGKNGGAEDCLEAFYPGSCLVTGRDIITLWVARMTLMGLYNIGDIPFTDCFVHANILDGKGERMSKSAGNGIDPVDIISQYGTDAMRYVLCEMQTGNQDIRLPVQAVSPFTGKPIELAKAKHGRSKFTYLCPESGKEFDVLGTIPELPNATLVSDRFDVGRNFCNKLWNAARFAFMNLEGVGFTERTAAELEPEDRFILSRLTAAIRTVHGQLEAYNPAMAIGAAREFFWSELCDWYLELIKDRMADDERRPLAQQVLATVLDQVLRLLHPSVPFITETLWESLSEVAPTRGIDAALPSSDLLVTASWPSPREDWVDEAVEKDFALLMEVVRSIRDIRAKHEVAPKERITAVLRAADADHATLESLSELLRSSAGLASLEVGPDAVRPKGAATAVVGSIEIYIPGVIDLEKEKSRLEKERDKLLKNIALFEKKLGNENFVARAKPEIVEAERTRLKDAQAEIAGIEKSIDALG